MSMPGFQAGRSLYRSRQEYRATAAYAAAETGLVVPAVNWGDFRPAHCTKKGCINTEGEGCGRRRYSAILWNPPWGTSWYDACYNTPATIGTYNQKDGYLEFTFSGAHNCTRQWFRMWGEFDVPDSTCDTEYDVGPG
jgi:hypothetical protein